MKRATITLPDDLEQALEQFVEEQEVPVQLTAVVQAAVREYLGERGYLETSSPLRIHPANRDRPFTSAASEIVRESRT